MITDPWSQVHYRIAGKRTLEAKVVCVQSFDYGDYEFLNERLFEKEEHANDWLLIEQRRMLGGDYNMMRVLEIASRYLERTIYFEEMYGE